MGDCHYEDFPLAVLPGEALAGVRRELAHLHRETTRVQKIIEDEFEQIDPEDRV
jgi:hypothetical protein